MNVILYFRRFEDPEYSRGGGLGGPNDRYELHFSLLMFVDISSINCIKHKHLEKSAVIYNINQYTSNI